MKFNAIFDSNFVVKIILGLFISIGIYFFLLSKSSLNEIFLILKETHLNFLFIAVISSVISNIFINSYRLKLILKEFGCAIEYKESLLIRMGSHFFRAIFPLKLGEFSRLIYLKRIKNFTYLKASLTILSEYILNISILILLTLIGWFTFLMKNYMINIYESIFNLSLFINSTQHKRPHLDKNRFPSSKLEIIKGHSSDIIHLFTNKKIFICSLCLAVSALFTFYSLALALDIKISMPNLLMLTPLVILSGILPVTFAGIGNRELSIFILFNNVASEASLISLGILYYLIDDILILIIDSISTKKFITQLLK